MNYLRKHFIVESQRDKIQNALTSIKAINPILEDAGFDVHCVASARAILIQITYGVTGSLLSAKLYHRRDYYHDFMDKLTEIAKGNDLTIIRPAGTSNIILKDKSYIRPESDVIEELKKLSWMLEEDGYLLKIEEVGTLGHNKSRIVISILEWSDIVSDPSKLPIGKKDVEFDNFYYESWINSIEGVARKYGYTVSRNKNDIVFLDKPADPTPLKNSRSTKNTSDLEKSWDEDDYVVSRYNHARSVMDRHKFE